MMKAALIHKYGQKELSIEEVPLPTIHDNDVLVKIIAASINPIDLKTKDGKVDAFKLSNATDFRQ